MHKPVCILFYYRSSGIISVAEGVTVFILSGSVLKSLFAGISSKVFMRKSALKISMTPQKWLASQHFYFYSAANFVQRSRSSKNAILQDSFLSNIPDKILHIEAFHHVLHCLLYTNPIFRE